MLHRFVSAASVGAVLIGLAGPLLYLNPIPTLEGRYLVTTVWCLVPLVWGIWAMLIPSAWLPGRIPLWGAILGLVAGLMAGFVLDIPYRLFDATTTTPVKFGIVVLAVVLYGLVWIAVRGVYVKLRGAAG
jgi:hypothetical protein